MSDAIYWVAIYTRDGAETLEQCLNSIINQSIPPSFIVVVNDGSTDSTPRILSNIKSRYQALRVVNHASKTRDIRRAPILLNLALAEAGRMPQAKFMMISGDDCLFPKDYASTIISRMDASKDLVVTSGHYQNAMSSAGAERVPQGAGRFVRMDFMKRAGGRYPVVYGWESWLLFKALQLRYAIMNFEDVQYSHLRPYRATNVYSWGRGMYSLGYPMYYVLFRFLKNLFASRALSRKANISMLAGYVSASVTPSGIKSMIVQDKAFRQFVKRNCNSRLLGSLR